MSVYKETFVSPFHKDTREEALSVLAMIRSCHSPERGWVEIKAYVEQIPNTLKWRAVRVHQKIS